MLNDVVRACPFHCTTDPLTKLLPVTTRVKFSDPAFTVDGDTEVNEGIGLDWMIGADCWPQLAKKIMKSAVQSRGMRLMIPLLGAIRSCFRCRLMGSCAFVESSPKLRQKLRLVCHMLYIFGFIISIQLQNALWTPERSRPVGFIFLDNFGEDFRMLPFLPSFLPCKLGESCEIDARCTSDFILSITDLGKVIPGNRTAKLQGVSSVAKLLRCGVHEEPGSNIREGGERTADPSSFCGALGVRAKDSVLGFGTRILKQDAIAAPIIPSISPSSATAGDEGLTLTVKRQLFRLRPKGCLDQSKQSCDASN